MTTNTTVVIPTLPVARKRLRWWMLPLFAALVVSATLLKFRPWQKRDDTVATGQFHTVLPTDLEVKIVKDGELQAIRYIDVECRVEGTSQIIWLVKEGTYVEKGEELVKLDSSNLQIRKENVDLDVKRAESNLKISQELKGIQENKNAADLEAAKVSLELAGLALSQYEKGTYQQQHENAKTARDMARLNLKQKEDDLEQMNRLFAKGFVMAADVKKAELDVINSRNEVKKTETALFVLETYTRKMELTKLRSDLVQAEQALQRVVRLNASLLNQRTADLEEKENALELYRKQADKLQTQLDNCTIIAPEDGLVIYMSTIDRWGREPIQEGANVRFSQGLIRLPDVRNMKAVVRIQETQKPRLDITKNQRASVEILGLPGPVNATLTKVSVLPDSSQRWWNPDLKEYPIELALEETPPGLKPGTSCKVTILIEKLPNSLTVPLASLYTVGQESYVFVRTGDRVRERKVRIGLSNETHIQISEGINEGEQVLLLQAGQGRALLEKAGIATQTEQRPSPTDPETAPTTQPARAESPRPSENRPPAKPAAPRRS